MTQEHVLVAGASGVVGYAAMKLFAERVCRVTAVSRRPPLHSFGADHLAVDLTDADACRQAFGGLTDVTRVVYIVWRRRSEPANPLAVCYLCRLS